jgi:general secretion pathway protein L
MQIVAIIRRWIEVLAALLLAWRARRREGRSLIIRDENGQFVIRQGEPDRDAIIRDGSQKESSGCVLSAGRAIPGDMARAARDGFIILELPANRIVTRRTNVPAQAREFLAGVVRNQLERLSPWPTEQAVYGFDAEVSGEDAALLDVRVLITSRAVIDSAVDELAAMGLRVDRIVARESDAQMGDKAPRLVAIWSRLADASRESLEGMRRRIGIGIAAAIGTAVVLTLWALVSASSIRDENEALAARSKALQRQVQAGRTPASMASLPPAERAWVAKEVSAASVIVLEALSRALPDTAYLTEIRLEGATLRIVGLADDAPALLAPLDQSGHLSNVRFFAPTTRGPDGKRFRFHIEARVEPRIRIAEEKAP